MTAKKARPPVRWTPDDNGNYFREADGVVVASVNGRRFVVPAVFDIGGDHCPPIAVELPRPGEMGPELVAHLTGEVRIADGRPAFGRVELTVYRPMTAVEMARLPWGKFAEMAVVAATSPRSDERAAVQSARKRDRDKARARRTRELVSETVPDGGRVYRKGTSELLDEVERLRVEAEAQGLPYARFVGERLGYTSDAYVRRLAKKARDRR